MLLILVPIIGLLLWLNVFMNPQPISDHSYHMPLYQLLVSICQGNSFVMNLLAFLVLIATAFGLVQLNEKYIFIKQRTDLPALLFVLLTTSSVVFHGAQPSIFAALFILLGMGRFFGVYRSSSAISASFDTGIALGVATLFYFHSFLFAIWLWIGLLIMGCFRFRELFAGILGFLTPLFMAFAWYFWFDHLPEIGQTLSVNLKGAPIQFELTQWQLYFWGLIGFLVIYTSFFMLNVYEEKRTSSRKYFFLILCYFVINIITFFLFPSAGLEIFFLAAVPITYIISHYFELQRHRWLGEVLFGLLLVGVIVIQFL